MPANAPKYFVQDFSPLAIARGQVEINRLLTIVNEKTRVALEQLEITVQKIAADTKVKVDLRPVTDAINAVREANQQVAGPFPPGCDPGLVDR